MRVRVSLSSRKRHHYKNLTRKQKMDSRRRGKRKSPSQDIIFEVSDNDISADNSEDDCEEPVAKISRTEDEGLMLELNENSNLETTNTRLLNVEISVNQEQTNSIEISEHISVSNSSCDDTSQGGSDIVVISEDNIDIDVGNDNETNYTLPRVESVDNSVDSSDIIDITGDNSDYLTGPEESLVPAEQNAVLPQQPEDVEDEELDDSQICIQSEEQIDVTKVDEDEPAIDVTGLSLLEVDVQDAVETDSYICISFSNDEIADVYKEKFLKFLQQFVELEVTDSEGLSIRVRRDEALNPKEWVVLDETHCLAESAETDEQVIVPLPLPVVTPSKKKKKKRGKKEKQLFILDTNPSLTENASQFTIYSTKFQIDTNDKASTDEDVKAFAQVCFNCGEKHAMKDCPLPKDYAKINIARQKFKAQKQTSRYHLEEEQKFSHMVPGKISDQLREALGLRKNQLPAYVYNMRQLGYPPGWLEEAKYCHSNLSLFDGDGKNVRSEAKRQQGLDRTKIVDYPGFNVPMDKNMKDEYRHYHVPPYSDNFSKEAMVEFFEKQCVKEQDDTETCDMDLDETMEEDESAVAEAVIELPPTNPLLKDLKEVDADLPSPSLVDLEKEKEHLLAALDENSSSKSVCEEVSDQDKPKEVSEQVVLDEPLTVSVEPDEGVSTPLPSPPLNSSLNAVKTSMFGTPILKSSSPYSRLPNPDNFMKDVSPVINFENLPHSTGKYEQMTGVLQKVRNTLKGLQNCKS